MSDKKKKHCIKYDPTTISVIFQLMSPRIHYIKLPKFDPYLWNNKIGMRDLHYCFNNMYRPPICHYHCQISDCVKMILVRKEFILYITIPFWKCFHNKQDFYQYTLQDLYLEMHVTYLYPRISSFGFIRRKATIFILQCKTN